MNIQTELGKRMLFFDGAMGTLLQANGLRPGELPEMWNLTHPDVVRDIHTQYRRAGCDILKANTFGANAAKLGEETEGHSVAEIVSAGVHLAKKAVAETGGGYVALDIGPTGKLLRPMGDLAFEDAVSVFAEMVRAGVDAGADLILIETMSDLYETKAAVLAAKENSALPVFVTLIFDETGKLLTGGDIPSAAALLEGLGVDAIGLNCGLGPVQMGQLFPLLREWISLPIVINPNAGLPECVNGCTRFNVEPEEFSSAMAGFAASGAWIVGGCCGTTPEHLAQTVEKCRAIIPKPLKLKRRTWISSYAKTVVFGGRPVLIGERINPTGKSRLKQALRENDMDYLLREAVTQQQNGADALDVNVGLPEIDETAMMRRLIPELQSVTDLPLQIDTSDPAAMEAALRLYNGRPLLNSVNGKAESMHAVFPLLKKYGGSVIALTLDESGIPANAQSRVAIAERIIRTAADYGIPKEALIFDPLAMAVSADQTSACTVLEALRLIRDTLGCKTSLGVSNISFGLPQRDIINTTFFAMALQSGLGAAILNPSSRPMMNAFYAYCALSGLDANCQEYIAACTGMETATTPQSTGAPNLTTAVMRGLKESAVQAAGDALLSAAPLEIIDKQLVPALDFVGQEFEAKRLYLPQLLMSAEAAKAVFELLRSKMSAGDSMPAKKGKVILATVRGDVHDIGKNIVKVLLENYGYQVFDLGKDVSPEVIVFTAVQEDIRLVGLSALMTTTVTRMEETIRLLRQEKPDCHIMVGGAVLTADYAQSIGADFYGKDAMSSVRYADKIFS